MDAQGGLDLAPRSRALGMTLSPISARRWANFKANKRGYWSLWIVGILVFTSFLAEFIANDKPIAVVYEGKVFLPVLVNYPETEFGGVFETEADYLSPALQARIDEAGWMLSPIIPFSHDTIDLYTTGAVPEAPSPRHWLGTDDVGRDVTARIIYGFRLSVLFGVSLTLFSAVIGVAVGATQGTSADCSTSSARESSKSGPACRCCRSSSFSRASCTRDFSCSHWCCCCSTGYPSSRWSARSSCVRGTSSTSRRPAHRAWATSSL